MLSSLNKNITTFLWGSNKYNNVFRIFRQNVLVALAICVSIFKHGCPEAMRQGPQRLCLRLFTIIAVNGVGTVTWEIKYDTLIQCCFTVGPAVKQHSFPTEMSSCRWWRNLIKSKITFASPAVVRSCVNVATAGQPLTLSVRGSN